MDSNLGSYINGGTVIALGSTMDWAESNSDQVTMNLQLAAYQDSIDAIVVTTENGSEVFSYDPAADTVLGENARKYMGAVISCADFKQGESYQVYVGGNCGDMGGNRGQGSAPAGEGNTLFYMQDKVNCFSCLTAVSK